MGEMRLYYSAIKKYADNCDSDYNEYHNDVEDILYGVDKFLDNVSDDYQYITNQLSKCEYLDGEINMKIEEFSYQRDLFLNDAQEHQNRINYLYANPKIKVKRDGNGNVTTEKEYDYAQIHREESLRNEANHKADILKGKIAKAQQIKQELSILHDKCKNLREAIKYMLDLIEKSSYKIGSYLRMIKNEQVYNINSLNKVINNVEDYLNSPTLSYKE